MVKPSNIDECMIALVEHLSAKDQADILKMSKNDLAMLHHSLGQWIRNTWDLWKEGALKEHMSSLGFVHPDDMSQAIIVEFWNRLNNQDSEIKQDAENSQVYWKNKNN